MSLELDEHRLYLSDRERLDAFTRALHEVVRPDDIVLDLGAGTGILGMLACRAGAARVYAVDNGPMAGIARAVVKANHLQDRIMVLRDHSTQVTLPEPATLIVTDQIGNFGFNAGLFEYLADARARLLAPGGRTLPAWVELWCAPAESAALREQVRFWEAGPAGFDYSPALAIARSTGYTMEVRAADLLAEGAMTIRVEPPTATTTLTGTAECTIRRAGTLDGIAGWFRAGLSPAVTMTNAPAEAARINRRPVMLPLVEPRSVRPGDRIVTRLRVIAPLSVIEWRVAALDASGERWVERGSTFNGLLMSREDLARTRPGWTPSITSLGRARQTVLGMCDGRHTLAAIEAAVLARHGDVVSSAEAAAVFVAEVVTRYAE